MRRDFVRDHGPRRWLAGVAWTGCLVAACQALDDPRPETIFFPQPAPHAGPTAIMAALGSGTLALEHNCLWLRTGPERRLIIWPALDRLVLRGGRLTVLDSRGAEFAHVGDVIQLVGGELTGAGAPGDINVWVESRIGASVPAACRQGSYWDAAGSAVNLP